MERGTSRFTQLLLSATKENSVMGKVKFTVSVYSLFLLWGNREVYVGTSCFFFQCKRSYHSFINLNFIQLAKHAITVEFVLEKAIAVRGDNVIFF